LFRFIAFLRRAIEQAIGTTDTIPISARWPNRDLLKLAMVPQHIWPWCPRVFLTKRDTVVSNGWLLSSFICPGLLTRSISATDGVLALRAAIVSLVTCGRALLHV